MRDEVERHRRIKKQLGALLAELEEQNETVRRLEEAMPELWERAREVAEQEAHEDDAATRPGRHEAPSMRSVAHRGAGGFLVRC
ncbi:MAG: hypothetical protein NZ898_14205 [Myxococcota bacterium]|nr:hypothetical protein [Myxococcota bacterium]MDW8362210.1 hypothetical protein [Myxococcales bacterium]